MFDNEEEGAIYYRAQLRAMKRKKHPYSLLNKVYGKLTVIGEAPRRDTHKYWKCRCDCGHISEVSTSNLVGGNTRTCGKSPCRWENYRIRLSLEKK
jgi:hypothetical protein